jgi:hypothetical protein
MQYGQDQYQKAERFFINNIVDAGNNQWYSYQTVNRNTQCAAVLATNTSAAPIPFNIYSLGEELGGITNEILFSENIRGGVTTGASNWNLYGASNPTVSGSVYSNIVMPDGSTNGVMLQTTNIGGSSANNGIYFDFASTGILEKGKMYTFSVWIACDSRESFPSTTTSRLSYYSAGSLSSFSEDFNITTTPRRVSHTFVASNPTSVTGENVAIGNGSGIPPAARLVLWGAQLIEGNTAGTYVPTSREWNGVAVGGASTVARGSGAGVKRIIVTPLVIPANSSTLINSNFFAIATQNDQNVAPPSGLLVYGLY